MTNAIIAGRKSSKVDNETGEGISLDSQDAKARDFAEKNGITIVASTRDVISGTTMPMRRKDLGRWLTDPSLIAQYDAVIAYKTDRFSRGPDTDWSAIETWAAEHGKTLIMVNESDGVRYPSRGDSDYWQWVSAKREARREWENSQERSIRAQESIKANGGLIGRAPWGMAIEGKLYAKTLVATPEGAKYLPVIFAKVANGTGLLDIAKWLDAEGIKPIKGSEWSAKSISQMIRNETYVGTRKSVDGSITLHVEPMISAQLFEQANKKLDNSPRGQRGPRTQERAMLSGALQCGICGGNMARIMSGYNASRRAYYRCYGKGTKPKGCGAPMVTVEELDKRVSDIVSLDTRPILEVRFVPGTDKDGELARIKKAIRDLDIDADSYDADYSRLMMERKNIMALDVVPDRYMPVDTGETYASKWASSDDAGKRAMLKHDARVIVGWTHKGKAEGLKPEVHIVGAGFEVPDGFKVMQDGTWLMSS